MDWILFPLTAAGAGFGVNFDKAWDARWLHGLQCFFHLAVGGERRGRSQRLPEETPLLNYHCFWEVETNFAEKYNEIRNPPFFLLGAVGEAKNYQRQVADGFFWPTISYILNH